MIIRVAEPDPGALVVFGSDLKKMRSDPDSIFKLWSDPD